MTPTWIPTIAVLTTLLMAPAALAGYASPKENLSISCGDLLGDLLQADASGPGTLALPGAEGFLLCPYGEGTWEGDDESVFAAWFQRAIIPCAPADIADSLLLPTGVGAGPSFSDVHPDGSGGSLPVGLDAPPCVGFSGDCEEESVIACAGLPLDGTPQFMGPGAICSGRAVGCAGVGGIGGIGNLLNPWCQRDAWVQTNCWYRDGPGPPKLCTLWVAGGCRIPG